MVDIYVVVFNDYICYIIGKLTFIFYVEERDGEWDKRLGLGNFVVDKFVNDYLYVVFAE